MLTVNLVKATNYDNERLVKLHQALKLIQAVLNSTEFSQNVLGFTTNGNKTFFFRRSLFGRWIDKPYTNDAVYNIIMTASEEEGNLATGSIDLYLELVNGGNGNVIGYGNPGSKEIYTYSSMFDDMSFPDLANHYSHEWCHKLGFEHSFHRAANRNNSVPYGVGNIIERLSNQFMARPDFLSLIPT